MHINSNSALGLSFQIAISAKETVMMPSERIVPRLFNLIEIVPRYVHGS